MSRRKRYNNTPPASCFFRQRGISVSAFFVFHFSFFIFFSALSSRLSAQNLDTIIFNQPVNVIENAHSLNYFFDKLVWLESKHTGNVAVLHVGDSHIQADMLTQPIRVGLQRRFGNAGRGLVFPHSVVKSNGSASVKANAKGFWTGGRNVQAPLRKYCGVSGFFAATYDSTASLLLKVNDKDSMDYEFAYASVFCQIGDSSYTILAGDSTNIVYYEDKDFEDLNELRKKSTKDNHIAYTQLANYPTNYVLLQNIKTGPKQNQTIIHGVVLSNGSPGIMYHVAGVNGAHYSDWATSPLFFRQAHDLSPQLVIVSMGTNEAFGAQLDTNVFYKQIDSLMTGLMGIYPPQTGFILTTPPDCFKRRKYGQPNLPLVARTIKRYAADYSMAVWDMYNITGGYGSRAKWKKYYLIAGDGVHFSKAGYNMQGRMFLQALLNAYDDYKKALKD